MTPFSGHWRPRPEWVCFLLFLAANSLLSCFSFPGPVQLGIGLAGVAFPFAYSLSLRKGSSPVQGGEEFLPEFSRWGWITLFAAAVLARFVRLTTLSTWPLVDEGTAGYFALELSEHWRWDFFYAYAQWPPLFVWCLGLFFKICGPSLFSLWLFPALLSLLALPLAYAAARAFFPRSFAWVFAFLWAFGYEPLYLGRLCLGQGLEILFQLSALALLGVLLKPSGGGGWRGTAAFGLGLIGGLGFFTYHHWPLMALFLGLAVLGWGWGDFRNNKGAVLLFLVPFALTTLLYFFLFFSTGQGAYLNHIFALKQGLSRAQLVTMGQYLGSLFWGVQTERYAYKPAAGGFLNPVASSLFFGGLTLLLPSLLRRGGPEKNSHGPWILLGLFLFSLPALASTDLEMLRTLFMLPLMLSVCVLGLQGLLPASPRFRVWVLAVLLGSTAGWDLYRLWGPYQDSWHSDTQAVLLQSKSLERFRAYQVLGSMSRLDGPGLVFTELAPSPFDQTFTVAVDPFNAARNPGLEPGQARWAAFLANVNYAPFLSRRFPESHWFPLSSDQASPPGELVLGVVPLTSQNRGVFVSWLDAERALHPVTSTLFHQPFGLAPGEVLGELVRVEPGVRGDPFLESCLDERIFYAAMACSDLNAASGALQRGLEQGYPAANLFNDLGVLWWSAGDKRKARQAFGLALRCPFNRTPAAENLWKAR